MYLRDDLFCVEWDVKPYLSIFGSWPRATLVGLVHRVKSLVCITKSVL